MTKEDQEFTVYFNQFGDFLRLQLADGRVISEPTHNMMRDPPHGPFIAQRGLGELLRLDLGDGRYAWCYHLYNCDCVQWGQEDAVNGFTITFNQFGDFLRLQLADGCVISEPTHNMMRDPPHGPLIAQRGLGELLRLDLGDGRYAWCYHLCNCDCIQF
jgi:hypothetical protein